MNSEERKRKLLKVIENEMTIFDSIAYEYSGAGELEKVIIDMHLAIRKLTPLEKAEERITALEEEINAIKNKTVKINGNWVRLRRLI